MNAVGHWICPPPRRVIQDFMPGTAAQLKQHLRRHEVDPQLFPTQLEVDSPPRQSRMRDLAGWFPDQWKIRHPAPGSNGKP